MIQLAWRWLTFQKESALTVWFNARTEGAPRLRKKMAVALARKLLIARWRMTTTGEVPARYRLASSGMSRPECETR